MQSKLINFHLKNIIQRSEWLIPVVSYIPLCPLNILCLDCCVPMVTDGEGPLKVMGTITLLVQHNTLL